MESSVEGKKRILLVSNGFYPEISPRSYRATELAKEFFRQGHEVTVISKFRDHDYSGFLREFPINFKMWDKYTFPKLPAWNKKPFSFLSRSISRILSMFFEYPAIEDMFKVRKILKSENGYHMMISFAVPHPVHWGVARARTQKNRIAGVWCADCGDPYMGDRADSFRKLFYFKYFEKSFCCKADFITIPFEGARKAYYKEFWPKIHVIPQGFSLEGKPLPPYEKKGKPPAFAYSGTFIQGKRDPRLFLNSWQT